MGYLFNATKRIGKNMLFWGVMGASYMVGSNNFNTQYIQNSAVDFANKYAPRYVEALVEEEEALKNTKFYQILSPTRNALELVSGLRSREIMMPDGYSSLSADERAKVDKIRERIDPKLKTQGLEGLLFKTTHDYGLILRDDFELLDFLSAGTAHKASKGITDFYLSFIGKDKPENDDLEYVKALHRNYMAVNQSMEVLTMSDLFTGDEIKNYFANLRATGFDSDEIGVLESQVHTFMDSLVEADKQAYDAMWNPKLDEKDLKTLRTSMLHMTSARNTLLSTLGYSAEDLKGLEYVRASEYKENLGKMAAGTMSAFGSLLLWSLAWQGYARRKKKKLSGK